MSVYDLSKGGGIPHIKKKIKEMKDKELAERRKENRSKTPYQPSKLPDYVIKMP